MATMSAATSPQVEPTNLSVGKTNPPSRSLTAGNLNSSTSDPNNPSVSSPNPDMPSRRKQPMKDFEWGGDLVRKTLPTTILPRWLDPYHVDVADPTELPLCWYGVPFVGDLIYPYTERIGLASYYTMEVLRAKPGDLDTFKTWANLEVWFRKVSGLKLDLNLVWGQPTPILTFCSNHESPNVTKKQLNLICDLLDDIDYDDEYQLMWYLDRNLDY